jgi:REP element-mobilizing transposase RayT
MGKPKCKYLYEKEKYYHIYNRGHRRSLIFQEKKDYQHFCNLMLKYLKKYDIVLVGYCLIPNHYHMILRLGNSVSDISKFMHRFMTAYCSYFNRKYNLLGAVFQNPFQARKLDGYEDLLNMIEYLKQNPVEARLVRKKGKYKWLYINRRSLKVLHRLYARLTSIEE